MRVLEKFKYGQKMNNFKPKIKVTANIAKNRLNITMEGNVDSKTLEKLYTDIRFCVADLKKGFEVINDVSQCNMLYVSGLPIYKKIMDYLIVNNVGQIVRIVRNDNITFKQLINFTEKIQCYKTIYAENKEEAEEKLEQLIKRDGIRFKLNKLFLEYSLNDSIGKACIIDISTSGCSVESSSLPVSVGVDILMSLHFDEHDSLLSLFTIKSQVIRANDGMFAVQFSDLSDDGKEQLYKRLAYEVGRTTCFP